MKEVHAPAAFELDPNRTACDILLETVRNSPDSIIFSEQDLDDNWKETTAQQFYDQARALAKGLIHAGLQPGESVVIASRARYEWPLIDFAVWFAGGRLVGVYETSSPQQFRWIIADVAAKFAFAENEQLIQAFHEANTEVQTLQAIWPINRIGVLAQQGEKVSDDELAQRAKLIKGSTPATIIYTSGTFGRPKGCIISHNNLYESVRATKAAIDPLVKEQESTVLFLPPAHSLARVVTLAAIYSGIKATFQPDADKLADTAARFQPTMLLGVPRLFEKIYSSMHESAAKKGKAKLMQQADEVAVTRSLNRANGKHSLKNILQHAFYDLLVYRRIRRALGGRIRWAVCGSAPLNERLSCFFDGAGIPIYQGYGLTESTAPITLSTIRGSDSSGSPLPGLSVKISDEGEILAKGPNLFQGYLHDAEATEQTMADGWLRTGDLGEITEDGQLRITGRIKEMVITSGGKNIPVTVLQTTLQRHSLISHALVCGDRKPFASALIALDENGLKAWLEKENLQLSLEEAAVDQRLLTELQAAIDEANLPLSRPEQIKTFRVIPVFFSRQNELLTPKFSVNIPRVLKEFAPLLESMYTKQTTPGT